MNGENHTAHGVRHTVIITKYTLYSDIIHQSTKAVSVTRLSNIKWIFNLEHNRYYNYYTSFSQSLLEPPPPPPPPPPPTPPA